MPINSSIYNAIKEKLIFSDQDKLALKLIEIAVTLSQNKTLINSHKKTSDILLDTMAHLSEFLPWESMAFYLTEEDNFKMAVSQPQEKNAIVAKQIRTLIKDGVFALSVRESRPITAYDPSEQQRLIFGPMNINGKLKGVFLGALKVESPIPSAVSLSLIRLVLGVCAESLEYTSQLNRWAEQLKEWEDLSQGLAIISLDRDAKLHFVTENAAALLRVNPKETAQNRLYDLIECSNFPKLPIVDRVSVDVSIKNKSAEYTLHLSPFNGAMTWGIFLPTR